MWPRGVEREYAERDRARAEAKPPPQHPSGYERVHEFLVVYDDPAAADALAAEYGTYAKHAKPRHPARSCWDTFSIVRLP